MTKSFFTANLDQVQKQFTDFLKPLGFSKSGRTYNRTTSEGLVQVINLQICRPDPIPPQFSKDMPAPPHDRFTVNLGVWVPEVADYHGVKLNSKIIQEHDCQVRIRLGKFAQPPNDLWWKLDESWPSSAAEALLLLKNGGLDFLERFGTRNGIICDWIGRTPDSRIVIAIIEAKRGHKEIACRLLEEQIAGTRNTSHQQYVRSLAIQLGLELS